MITVFEREKGPKNAWLKFELKIINDYKIT